MLNNLDKNKIKTPIQTSQEDEKDVQEEKQKLQD